MRKPSGAAGVPLFTWLLAAALLAAGCGHKSTPTGSADVAVTFNVRSAGSVAKVTVTVGPGDGSSFTPIVKELTQGATQWTGSIPGIPTGTGRRFDAVATDSAGRTLYSGWAKVDITASGPAVVTIVLSDASTGVTDKFPIIDSLTASQGSAAPGTVVKVAVTAHDPSGAALTYRWDATCGSLDDAASANAKWTAPASGSCQLGVTVRNSLGLKTTAYLTIAVLSGGSVQVVVTFNHSPVINNLVGQVVLGSPMEGALQVVATDPDGDPLSYAWSASAASITFATGAPHSSTAPAFTDTAPGADHVITVTVTDGKGGSTTGVFVLPPNIQGSLSSCVGKADGTPCDDGKACTAGDVCTAGVCGGIATTCATGTCVEPAGTCQTADLCAGVTCTASDQCHAVGACDPATGTCTNPAKADGSACSDANGCTTTDVCGGGVCVPGPAKSCTASDACHLGGTCDPATGSCSNPPAANGTACDDGKACTTGDVCTAGLCGGTAKSCTSGTCVEPAGTCQTTDLCAGVTCHASDACHAVGACDPATGLCSNPPAANGTACDDGKACTTGDVCTAGLCGGTQKSCTTGTCQEPAGTCPSAGPADPVFSVQATENQFVSSPSAMAYDTSGFVYQAGAVVPTGFDFGAGVVTSSGNQDMFVAKLDPSSGRATGSTWAKSYGDSTKNQLASSIAASSSMIGVAGRFQGTLALSGSLTQTNGGVMQDFVAGFDQATGAPAWLKAVNLNDPNSIGGQVFSIASSPLQSRFAVCGFVVNKAAADLGVASQPAGSASKDVVVAVLDAATGNVVWGKQFGGTGAEACTAAAMDDAGNVVIAGNYTVPFAIGGTTLPATGNSQWVFVAKLDAAGNVVAASGFGAAGATTASVRSVAVDSAGNVAFAAAMLGAMTVGPTALVPADPGNPTQAAVVGYTNGSLVGQWAAQLFTPNAMNAGNDARSVAFDSTGQVYLTGALDDGDPSVGAATLTSAGGGDTFVLRFDAAGHVNYSHLYGDFAGQDGWTVLVARLASGAEKDAIWLTGNYSGTITFGSLAPLVGDTYVRKYLVKAK